jgi:hypothetical protein
MKENSIKQGYLTISLILILLTGTIQSQDVFTLKPELVGQHPRILFTQAEADAHAILAQKYMPDEWQLFVNDCLNIGYTTNTSILGQQQWWYFSRLGIGIAMTRDQRLIDKGNVWLSTAYEEDWAFDADKTVGLDVAHKLAGFALLYDCMYNYLTQSERNDYEALLEEGLIKFRTHGYDIGDYWTNDYQNNHMHFRATASLYCAAILYDKFTDLQSEYNNVMTVWRRIGYMSPHDGSNHEGLNYSNYGGQMLYPGIYGLKHCTGMDLTASEHYHNVGYYYIHHLVPGMVSGFGFGDAGNSAASSGPNYLFQIANFTQDPYIQYTAHKLREKYASSFFLRQWFILFNDPLLGKKELTDLPLYRYFDDIGIVVSRSDWGPDATAVAFKCGPLGGKLINETRGTEYSWFTDYVNVAHDDPDAGTFLLFSKGSFLTTGDGYEKVDKITTQHSTFIVDDLTQYGGGGPWCQPEADQSRYAWQKDFFTVNDRVVFSGDMKGVYPNMVKLNRTFVSHKANYIIIYDDAVSSTAGRTFEWRLQTEGTLTSAGAKTYRITRGNGSALVRILSPETADWSTTTSTAINIDGRILRARLTGQQSNQYLVMLWPNAADLNTIAENYNTFSTIGVKVSTGGNNEYTLFQKADNQVASAGNIYFKGNTLLLVEDASDNSLKSVSLVNGDSLIYNSIWLFGSNNRINFGIDSISPDTSYLVYSIGPSSNSDTTSETRIGLGGLSANTTYYVFKEEETSSIEFTTDGDGYGGFYLDLDAPCRLIVSKTNINLIHLEKAIKEAQDIHDAAVEGSSPGEYKAGSKVQFALEIDSAENVLVTAVDQAEVDDAVTGLLEAIATFEAMVIIDLSILLELIDESDTLHDNAVEGTEEGQYEPGSKEVFKTAIDGAKQIAVDTTALQEEINDAVEDLAVALAVFQSKMVPITPLTVFSDIPYYGDFLNYTVNTKTLWEVTGEGGDTIVGMSNYSTTSGQYMLINDSSFQHFEISFDARSVQGTYPNDIMIVFGYRDKDNYSYAKLSSEINESGVFTRIGGPTKFSWLLEDFETYCVEDFEWTNYKMVSLDSLITLYRNDEELFSVEPQESLRYLGKVGVGTYYRNRAYFDDLTVTRLVSTVGMEDISNTRFIIYPNPSRDKITIEYDGDIKSLMILNLLGHAVKYIEKPAAKRMLIDVSGLEKGIYLTRLVSTNGTFTTRRLIKQ